MKLKTLFYVSLLCFPVLAQPAKAQWRIGLSAGWNKNYLHASLKNRPFSKYDPVDGFALSIPVQYHFNSWLALQADPGIIKKSFQLTRTGFFSGIYHQQRNCYVQLPVMARFAFGGRKLTGFLNLGGYAAYWMSGRQKGVVPNMFDPLPYEDANGIEHYLGEIAGAYPYNEKHVFNGRRDNRLELGLMAGTGISYAFSGSSSFFVEARYYRGLTDLQKNYMINNSPRYNDTYLLQAGYLFQLQVPKQTAH